jgi:hypothetical protein
MLVLSKLPKAQRDAEHTIDGGKVVASAAARVREQTRHNFEDFAREFSGAI